MPLAFSRNIYPELFSTDKWCDMDAGQRLLCIYLFAGEKPTKCGIIPKRYHEMIDFAAGLLDRSSVDAALELFASPAYGWIEYDDRYIWVRDFIEDQSNSTNWTTSALDEAYRLRDKTHLADNCLLKYAEKLGWKPYSERRKDGKRTASERRKDGDKTASGRKSQSQIIPLSTEVDNGPADAGDSPSAKPGQTAKPYTEADLEVANWIIKIAEKLRDSVGFGITNPRTPESIASGIHKSGLSHADIRTTFQWAARDPYQREGVCNLVRWTKGEQYVQLRNKYLQQREIEHERSGGLLPGIGE